MNIGTVRSNCELLGASSYGCVGCVVWYYGPRTMLHIWLIPALLIFAVAVGGFYLLIKFKGGSGVRTEGKTVVDKPMDDDNPPPG